MAGTTYIIYGGTGDSVGQDSNATYSTARLSTIAAITGATTGELSHSLDAGIYTCGQVFFGPFDTSTVPAGGSISKLSLNVSVYDGNADSNLITARQTSGGTVKVGGGGYSAHTPALTSLASQPWPTGTGRFTIKMDVGIARSSTFKVLIHSNREQSGATPTGIARFTVNMAEETGTTNDPFLSLTLPWDFVGVSTPVSTTTTTLSLVEPTTPLTPAEGDLLIACIGTRQSSPTAITLPSGWTLIRQSYNSNVTVNSTTSTPSGLMAYIIRGSSPPALDFTLPATINVGYGRIIAFRGVDQATPIDVHTVGQTASNSTSLSLTGITTTGEADLLVSMIVSGRTSTFSNFNALTYPIGGSGATAITPPAQTWTERADSSTTDGADVGLGIADAIKVATGATGSLSGVASLACVQMLITCAFKYAPPAAAGVTHVKHSGTWKPATTYVKHSGTWKVATAHVKSGGTWKQV